MTAAQRRRLAHMLRALDGRAEGASQLEIALGLFGRRLVTATDWPSSSLRYTIQRLLHDGQRMVGGGYRELLRSRRRSAS